MKTQTVITTQKPKDEMGYKNHPVFKWTYGKFKQIGYIKEKI